MIIAIDGPSGAGKSSVSKEVATRLGFACLDTGAMYRSVAWQAKQNGVALDDEDACGEIARTYDITFEHEPGNPAPIGVKIGGSDVTSAIRTAEIDRAVSPVSALPAVREALVAQQQRIGRLGDYVVEGRDIGTVVFPDAELKVFLTASNEARAKRRVLQNADRGVGSTDFDEVLADIIRRDEVDSSRAASPLKPADDAVHIDSSDMSMQQVIDEICALAQERKGQTTPPADTSKPKKPEQLEQAPAPTAAPAKLAKPAAQASTELAPAEEPEKPKKFEALFDLPFGVDEYATGEKRFSRTTAHFIVGTVSGICKILYRYDVENVQNLYALAERGGVVVVSNHTSYLDVVFMYLSMYPRYWPRFMARDSFFRNHGPLGWIFAHIGAFPIKRDTADRVAVKRAARMLKNGEIVGIMPEGSRRDKGTRALRVHGGAALIARMGRAPIMPMAVRNVDKVKRPGERLRFPKITVEFGNPVLVEDFNFLPKDERLEACVWYALRECFALFQGVTPEDVDMAALFPEDKDYSQVFAEHPIPRLSSEEVAEILGARKKPSAKRIATSQPATGTVQ